MTLQSSLLLPENWYESGNDWNRANARGVIWTMRPGDSCPRQSPLFTAVMVNAGSSWSLVCAGRGPSPLSAGRAYCPPTRTARQRIELEQVTALVGSSSCNTPMPGAAWTSLVLAPPTRMARLGCLVFGIASTVNIGSSAERIVRARRPAVWFHVGAMWRHVLDYPRGKSPLASVVPQDRACWFHLSIRLAKLSCVGFRCNGVPPRSMARA